MSFYTKKNWFLGILQFFLWVAIGCSFNNQSLIKEEINVIFMPTTAFREESFQKTLYDNYVNNYGSIQADTFSARPGYSEHQTGLAIDLKKEKSDMIYKFLSL